jgi:hypothetical protein
VQAKRELVQSIIERLGISRNINNFVIEGTDSPWMEKALIKRKKGALDVKLFVWADESFLYGRIYRIFLYIADVLDKEFLYDPRITPDEEKEPFIRDRYNQIWSLYVDSRMERLGIESFFDRILRRNLFIDFEKGFGWHEAGIIFDSLWSTPSFTYPQIIDLTYHLEEKFPANDPLRNTCLEKTLAECLHDPTVLKHIDKLDSNLAVMLNDLLSFAAYSCKDGRIIPCHYGIVFLYANKVFFEIIPASGKNLVFSILDPRSQIYDTSEITDQTPMEEIQKNIRERYGVLSMHAQH